MARSLRGSAALALALLVASCGGAPDGGADAANGTSTDPDGTASPSEPTTETTDLPPCGEEDPRVVIFGINGVLTSDEDVTALLADASYDMTPAPGAVDLVSAYADQGYEILYATRGDEAMAVGDQTYAEALDAWFQRHDFPVGERARLLTGAFTPELKDELLTMTTQGQDPYAAYTDVAEYVEAFQVAGIPLERIYTLGDAAGTDDTVAVTGGDLAAHLDDAGAPPPVCMQPGEA